MATAAPDALARKRVLVLGATGTIGRATVRALAARGHEVVCMVRTGANARELDRAVIRAGDATDPVSVAKDGICGERFDAVISCLASRTGAPADAWAIDHRAQLTALAAAKAASIPHFVLLSAICVQKPRLAFQYAKLAFEAALVESGLTWSIVRPTAYFKSLSGQVDRVRRGKPYLVFGDGMLTACKPISDDDLGAYLSGCIEDERRWNRILPIGGPGEALTPRQQGEQLFAILGTPPRFTHIPIRLLDSIIAVLRTLGLAFPALADKAELARIGRYYATESMLVLNPATGRYDASATPSVGSETLTAHFARIVSGETFNERGDHAVF